MPEVPRSARTKRPANARSTRCLDMPKGPFHALALQVLGGATGETYYGYASVNCLLAGGGAGGALVRFQGASTGIAYSLPVTGCSHKREDVRIVPPSVWAQISSRHGTTFTVRVLMR
jgi:hypothetical protein